MQIIIIVIKSARRLAYWLMAWQSSEQKRKPTPGRKFVLVVPEQGTGGASGRRASRKKEPAEEGLAPDCEVKPSNSHPG